MRPAIKESQEIDTENFKLTFKINDGNIRRLKFTCDGVGYYFEDFSQPFGMYMLDTICGESYQSIFNRNWQTITIQYDRYFNCFKKSKSVINRCIDGTTTSINNWYDVKSFKELDYKTKQTLFEIIPLFYRTKNELIERYFFSKSFIKNFRFKA